MSKVVWGGLLILLLVGAGVVFSMYVGFSNQEIDLRTQAKAQQGKIEVVFDKMVKIISGKAQVSTEYKNGFKDIFVGIMEGRYSKGDGALLKLVQEQNPTFDASLYKDLMQSIEVERINFANEQETMIDIIRVHTNLITKFPSSWFVGKRKPIEYTIISSTKSKEVMKTGVEDDVKIF